MSEVKSCEACGEPRLQHGNGGHLDPEQNAKCPATGIHPGWRQLVDGPIGRLVIRNDDDSPCPLVGEVIAQPDDDTLLVVWGNDRDAAEPARWAIREAFDGLSPYDA